MANWYWKVVRQFVAERFGVSLCRSSCLNYLHRLGFAFKRPRKRLVKANKSKRQAFVAEYAAFGDQPGRAGGKAFFAGGAHFQAGAGLRGKWVLRGEPALADSTSSKHGEKANCYPAVCLETGGRSGWKWRATALRDPGCLPGTVAGEARRASERDLGQCAGPSRRGAAGVPVDA